MKLTSTQQKKIDQICKKHGVKLMYVFGSRVKSRTSILKSDIDIAVLFKNTVKSKNRFNSRLLLIEELSSIFNTTADVAVLNDVASVFFKYTIISEGCNIYRDSEIDQADYESRVMGEYFDFKPFLIEYNKAYVARSLQ